MLAELRGLNGCAAAAYAALYANVDVITRARADRKLSDDVLRRTGTAAYLTVADSPL